MRKQIREFSIFQSSKAIALVTFAFSVVFIVPVMLLLYYISGEVSILSLFIIPFAYMFMAFIGSAIWFWIYNWIARSFGGIEISLED